MTMTTRREFQFVRGGSKKFWSVKTDGSSLVIQFGRIGTAGQTKAKPFPSETLARAAADKLIAEKTGKGYAEILPPPSSPPPPATASPAPPAKTASPGGAVKKRWSVPFRRSQVQCLGFTPDDQQVVAAGFRSVMVIDVATGAAVQNYELREPKGDCWAEALSPDARLLLLGISGGRYHVLDLATRKIVCRYPGHKNVCAHTAHFLPDGGRIVSGRGRLRMTPDGDVVAGTADLQVWEARTGKLVKRLSVPGLDSAFRLTPDGAHVVYSTDDAVRFWSIDRNRETLRIPDGTGGGASLSPDGRWLIKYGLRSPGKSGRPGPPVVRVWDLRTRKEIRSFQPGRALSKVAFRSGSSWWLGLDGVELPGVDGVKIGNWAKALISNDGRHVAVTSTIAGRDTVGLLQIVSMDKRHR